MMTDMDVIVPEQGESQALHERMLKKLVSIVSSCDGVNMLKLPRSCSDDVAFHIGATPAAIKELARKETLKELADDGVGLNDADRKSVV